jgi:hypothetical protein
MVWSLKNDFSKKRKFFKKNIFQKFFKNKNGNKMVTFSK